MAVNATGTARKSRTGKDLLQTLEDGKNGFAKGADKLEGDESTRIAAAFREFSTQRAAFYDELQGLAAVAQRGEGVLRFSQQVR